MNSADAFQLEWQRLQKKRQQLINETDQLKRKLNGLTEEPEMGQLLEEKRGLKKRVPELTDQVEMHKEAIEGKHREFERLRRAVIDKKLRQEFATRLKNRKERLARLEELNAPETIIENERRMVFEIEAPIEEVEKLYHRMNAESEQKQQAAQRVLNETLVRIATIEEHYRQTRHCLEEAVREVGRKRQGCRAEEVEWATQSRSHLEWILEKQPSYKDDVVRRYRARFPTDTLVDLFPSTPAPAPTIQRASGKKHKTRPSSPPAPVAEAKPATLQQPWRFWVTFNANDPGLELPQDKAQFLNSLQSALDKAAYHNLDVKLVYDKLLATSRMSMQQRQEMNKVVEADPLWWKILRVGKKHRLFLSVDEEKRHIRFLPCPRKKSYSHH